MVYIFEQCPRCAEAWAGQRRGWTTVTFAVEQKVLHVVAEGNVHVAAVELAGQAAAVERRDGVRTAWGGGQDSHFRDSK